MSDILDEDFSKPKKKFKKESFQTVEMFFILPFALGLLFKIMHWPFSALLILLGALSLSAYYIFGILLLERGQTANTNPLKYILGFLHGAGMAIGILAIGFKYGGLISKALFINMVWTSLVFNGANYLLDFYLGKNVPAFSYFTQYQARLVMLMGMCLLYILIPTL